MRDDLPVWDVISPRDFYSAPHSGIQPSNALPLFKIQILNKDKNTL